MKINNQAIFGLFAAWPFNYFYDLMTLLEQEKANRLRNQKRIRIALIVILLLLVLTVSAYILA